MAKYPYILKTGSLKKFFEKIPSVGEPSKITQQYIVSLGFKSTNDRTIIKILKSLGFLDDSGAPTTLYKKYRDKSKSGKVLGAAIRKLYAPVFQQYPDAQNKDHATLQNYFSTHTGLSETTVKFIVSTFKALCAIGDVEKGEEGEEFVTGSDKLNQSPVSDDASTYHNISFGLTSGKKAKIIIPLDATKEDIEKIKKLLDVLI